MIVRITRRLTSDSVPIAWSSSRRWNSRKKAQKTQNKRSSRSQGVRGVQGDAPGVSATDHVSARRIAPALVGRKTRRAHGVFSSLRHSAPVLSRSVRVESWWGEAPDRLDVSPEAADAERSRRVAMPRIGRAAGLWCDRAERVAHQGSGSARFSA